MGRGRVAVWSLNRKGSVTATRAESIRRARASNDPEVVKLREQLASLRDRESSKSNGGINYLNLKVIKDEADAVEYRLKRRLQALPRSEQQQPWITLDEIREALPPDAVLIDFLRIIYFDWRC